VGATNSWWLLLWNTGRQSTSILALISSFHVQIDYIITLWQFLPKSGHCRSPDVRSWRSRYSRCSYLAHYSTYSLSWYWCCADGHVSCTLDWSGWPTVRFTWRADQFDKTAPFSPFTRHICSLYGPCSNWLTQSVRLREKESGRPWNSFKIWVTVRQRRRWPS